MPMMMMTYLELLFGDGVVCEVDELLETECAALPDLAGQQETDSGQQLQLRARDPPHAQEAVHVVDGQREDLVFAAELLTNLGRQEGGVREEMIPAAPHACRT